MTKAARRSLRGGRNGERRKIKKAKRGAWGIGTKSRFSEPRLLLAAVSAILQVPPGAIPVRVSALLLLVVLTVMAIGLFVDSKTYAEPGNTGVDILEWLGFGVILASVFLLPRLYAAVKD